MSLLAKATKGFVRKPLFLLVYGTPGIGKSTFASRFPKPLFLALEEGTNQLDISRLQPTSYNDVVKIVEELNTTNHEYETLALDSLDYLEILIWDQVCADNKAKSISDIPYGGGYSQALVKWKQLLEGLKTLRNKMNVILIAHSIVKQVNDPSLPMPYDRHTIKLNQKAADLLKESVEAVLFCHYEIFVAKGDNQKSARAFGEGKRLMQTMATPSAEGKNRYSLPPVLPFDYDEFQKAVTDADPTDATKAIKRIEHYLAQVKDAALAEKAKSALQKAGTNLTELTKIEQKLTQIIEN